MKVRIWVLKKSPSKIRSFSIYISNSNNFVFLDNVLWRIQKSHNYVNLVITESKLFLKFCFQIHKILFYLYHNFKYLSFWKSNNVHEYIHKIHSRCIINHSYFQAKSFYSLCFEYIILFYAKFLKRVVYICTQFIQAS